MEDCNTSKTGGCTDDSSFSKVKSTTPKISDKLDDIEETLDNFSETLSIYCQVEQLNLRRIKKRVGDIAKLNTECCGIINAKLNELKVVIDEVGICEVTTTVAPPPPTTTLAPTTTLLPTTTIQPTTTIAPTTTIEATTTTEITTTALPTTTGEGTTTTAEITTTSDSTTTGEATTTSDGTTTEAPTTTSAGTTTPEPTTTVTPTTTETPTTTAEPTTTGIPEYSEAYSGTIYYVSESGDDGADGSKSTPFASITKVNTLTLSGDDAVLFESSGSYEGQITVGQSGTSGHPITFGAYGSTAYKPKIYGSEVITGWTLHSGNIWKATFATTINQLFVDNVRMQAARFPATDYATVDSAPTTSSLTDSALNGALNYTGVICLIHSSSYGLDKRTVTSSSGTTLQLSSAPFGSVTAGEKYILVGKLEFLTVAGQWFYDDNTNTVYLWKTDGTEPTDTEVRGSTFNYGVYASAKDYVSVKDIETLHQKIDGVYFTNSDHFVFDNITATDDDAVGLHNYLGSYGTIENCTVVGANHYGIENYSDTGNNQINSNNVSQIALFDNLGLSGIGAWYMGSGIFIQNSVTTAYSAGQINYARYNVVNNIGYNGIHFANEAVVEDNYITYCGYTKNDGGFIYTSGGDISHTGVNANSIIKNNIGLYGVGIGSSPYFEGIYADEYSENVTIEYNTVGYSTRGIFLHNGNNNIARYNTVFNCENGLYVSKDGDAVALNNNIVYGLTGQEVIHLNILTGTPVINSNKYINKYTANPFELNWTTYYTFANWKSTTGHDALSTFDNTALTSGYSEKLVVNPTGSTKTFYLNYATNCTNVVTGASLSGTFTVPAYSSIIVTGIGVSSIADEVVTYETPIDFGFDTLYGLTTTSTTRRAMPIVMPEDGMITSISFYHNGGVGNCLVGVYNNGAAVPNQRLGISVATAISVSAGWNTVDLITPVPVGAGTQVWLAVVPSVGGMRYEAGLPYRANASTSTYADGLSTSFNNASAVTVASYRHNIYCTYLK